MVPPQTPSAICEWGGLERNEVFMNKTPTTLIIMDGFGMTDSTVGNAIRTAATPRLDQFFQEFAHTTLLASGLDGIAPGTAGETEAVHNDQSSRCFIHRK